MSQSEQSNCTSRDAVSKNLSQKEELEKTAEIAETQEDWLPEDDDEWYEPDYRKSDRLAS